MKINELLDDEEIEECIDGSSNIEMIRDIIDKTEENGLIHEEQFADWFAYGVSSYIDAEEDSEEWEEANGNNYEWGYSIACNINELIEQKTNKGE